jgi:hypothetical protein
MQRTQHPSNNRVIGAPAGWDQKEIPCDALPVTDVVQDGLPWMVSFWRPTAAELATLQAGGTVALWISGRVHPVVAIAAEPAA